MANAEGPGRRAVPAALAALLLGLPAAADTPVAIEELDGDRCYAHAALGARTPRLVIETAAGYAGLFDPALRRLSCSPDEAAKTVVPVDFARKTVLGAWAAGNCADGGFAHRVLRDDAGRVLRYTVIIRPGPKPACMGPGPESLNLIAIDKLPAGYRVVFDTVHEDPSASSSGAR
jgi:hypothetical protein